MDFFEVVGTRRSIRAFRQDPVDDRDLNAMLEAARQAPSAGNLQAYAIYLVRSPRVRRELALAAVEQMFIAKAPVVLVFAADPARSATRYSQRGAELYCVQDATIACTFVMLAATAMGFATVWVGAFDECRVREAIGAPASVIPVAMLPLGKGAEKPGARGRRPLRDLVFEIPT